MSDGLLVKTTSPVLHAIKHLVSEDVAGARYQADGKLVLTPALRVVPERPVAQAADLLVLTPALAVAPSECDPSRAITVFDIDQSELRAMVAEMVRAELARPGDCGVADEIRQLVREEVARALNNLTSPEV